MIKHLRLAKNMASKLVHAWIRQRKCINVGILLKLIIAQVLQETRYHIWQVSIKISKCGIHMITMNLGSYLSASWCCFPTLFHTVCINASYLEANLSEKIWKQKRTNYLKRIKIFKRRKRKLMKVKSTWRNLTFSLGSLGIQTKITNTSDIYII